MKFNEIIKGSKIKHFCAGELVEAEVTEVTETYFKTKHAPVRWGQNVYETSKILRSTDIQYSTSQTTPGAFTIGGEKITI